MATTVLAQKCVTGNIESYLFKMKAGTLIDTVGYASEMEQWEDMKKIQFVTSQALQENYSLPTAFRTYREKIEEIEKILEEKSSPEPM